MAVIVPSTDSKLAMKSGTLPSEPSATSETSSIDRDASPIAANASAPTHFSRFKSARSVVPSRRSIRAIA